MYEKGLSQRDIAETIEDIYGFEISHEIISEITDNIPEQLEEWQNHPLKKFYTFLFVDCLYVTIRKDYETKNCAVCVILVYDVLRRTELYKKWNGRPFNNWALIRNQLDMDEKIQERIRKYENGGF